MNITMLVKDRPRLTEQALDSLRANTIGPYNLTIVDDGSVMESTLTLLEREVERGAAVIRNQNSTGVTAQARNLAIFWSRERFGEDSDGLLYLADNDSYFTYGWDSPIREAFYTLVDYPCVIGGQNHPYHHASSTTAINCFLFRQYRALAGTSWCMRWKTWDTFGPFKHGAPGVCQGEDCDFGEKIQQANGFLWAVWPHVVYDCGITQTGGTPSPGAEVKQRVDGVIYE